MKLLFYLIIVILGTEAVILSYTLVEISKKQSEPIFCIQDILRCDEKECLVGNRCYSKTEGWVEPLGIKIPIRK